MKVMLKVLVRVILVIVLSLALFLVFLTVTEYRPEPVEAVEVIHNPTLSVQPGAQLSFMTFNIGYAGLGADEDFVLDGGQSGRPASRGVVEQYFAGIAELMAGYPSDFYLMQEVDLRARRSFNMDQVTALHEHLGETFHSAFALNFKAAFVPFPVSITDHIGHVESGLQTLAIYEADAATRYQFPGAFSWPLRVANLKRAMLVTTYSIENSDASLIVANLHMSAYDGDGSLRAQEMAFLRDFLVEMAEAGHYVVIGGDFNQTFPGADRFPPRFDYYIAPVIEDDFLPEGFRFVFDDSVPTCRLLNQPYNPDDIEGTQYYIIDGFIVSNNLRVDHVETIDHGFAYSDHNPVIMQVTLLDETP